MNNKYLSWKLEHKKDCYKRLTTWWKSHDAFEGHNIPYNSMPVRVFTAMRKVGGELINIYSIAVYVTDSDMCWVGWITSNPHTTRKQRQGGLEYLYNTISEEMAKIGFTILISKTKQENLMGVLDKTGFKNIEPQTNFYIKNI